MELLTFQVSPLSGSVKLELTSVALTELAAPAGPVLSVWSVWQWMSILTVSSDGVLRGDALPAQDIVARWPQFQVRRIYASPRIAHEMIELRNATPEPPWQRFNEPCIQQAMDGHSDVSYRAVSIAAGVQRSGPKPAPSARLDANFRKDSTQLLRMQVSYGEILGFSHARVLLQRVRGWLGSRRCLTTVATCSLYIAEVVA